MSVAGKSGAVTLTKADVGLGNVDNTSDTNKPVSTSQATVIPALVLWDSTTNTWDARPSWARRAMFVSTDDPSATSPSASGLQAGDVWMRHPDAGAI